MGMSFSSSLVIKTIMSFGLCFIVLNIERFRNEKSQPDPVYCIHHSPTLEVTQDIVLVGIMQNITFEAAGYFCRHIFFFFFRIRD